MGESNAARIQRQFAEVAAGRAATTKGLVVSQDWDNGFVTVNVGGTEQRMEWAMSAPWPGVLCPAETFRVPCGDLWVNSPLTT